MLHVDKLRSILLNGMKKFKIKSVMVTSINMVRKDLMTKEAMESYYYYYREEQNSVNEDLESLFEKIRLGKELDEKVSTYYFPKLTEEELELVERRDTSYLDTFYMSNPDILVTKTKMKRSASYSNYVNGLSMRRTYVIENFSETSSENNCSLQ